MSKKPFIVKNGLSSNDTLVIGENGKLHANNTITAGTILGSMLEDSGTPTGVFGSASQVPVITVDSKGRITSIANTNVAGVTGFTYTAANNTLEITTADGGSFTATIDESEFSKFITVANTYANFVTNTAFQSVVANTNSYIATTAATELSHLANTNAYIASTLANTNAYIATKVDSSTFNAALANTNAYIATKVDTSTFNAALANTNAYIATTAATELSHLANTNSFIANVRDTRATWTALTGTNTSIRALVSDRMQVANVEAYLANTNSYIGTKVNTTTFNSALANTNSYIGTKASWSALTTTNTNIRTLVSDRIQVANAISTFATWNALTSTNTAIRLAISNEISALVNSAPTTLDTLNELAAALGDDPNFATTVSNSIGTKAASAITISAGSGLTGGGDLTTNRTISHADTSTQASVNNSNGTVIQDITLDGFGHITGLASVDLDGRYYTETEADSRYYRKYETTGISDYNSLTTGAWSTTSTTAGNIPYANYNGTWHISDPTNDRQYQLWMGDSPDGGLRFRAKQGSSTGWHSWNKIFHDSYHPNADAWTNTRTNTVTLTGDVTGSGSASVNGTGNWTVSLSTVVGDDSHDHTRLLAVDDRDMKPNTSGIGSGVKAIKAFFSSYGGMTGSTDANYQDVLVLDTYSDASGGNANAITMDKSDGSMRIWNAGQTATSWGTPQRVFADNYHPNADKWTTSRTLSLTGDVSGSTSWDGSGNASISVTVNNDSHTHSINTISDEHRLFNNMGDNHSTYTDFNSISQFGVRYVQGSTNGPGTGSSQFYGFSLGLGNEYAYSQYALQLAIPRYYSSDKYLSIRTREGGTWGSWSKIGAGNADTWTTSRTNTVTLTGDVTGSGSASVNGSGNWTVSLTTTVANDSHSHSNYVTTTYNSSLNSDSRNSRGVTRLYRRDDNSDYSVQTYWTGSYWRLYGYNGDSSHADVHVGYADSAGSAGNADTLDSQHGSYYNHRNYTDASTYLGGYYVSGGTEKPNNTIFGAGKFKVAMLSGSNLGYGGSWNDVMWISTYNGGDVKGSFALVFDKYSDNMYFSRQNFDSSSWGAGRLLMHSGNISSYAAPVSHSHDYVVEGGTSFSGKYPVVVRTSADVIYSDADIQFEGSNSQLTVNGSVVSPIFYDTNTAYYADPAGTSVLNNVYLNGTSGNYAIGKYHSGSDFTSGTLIVTNIDSSGTSGASYVLEVTGKSYSANPAFSFIIQGYIYNNTFINYSGTNISGYGPSSVVTLDYSGNLAFWFPRISYWNSFEARCRDAGGSPINRVTSIINSSEPSSTKKVTVTMRNSAVYGINSNTAELYATTFYDSNDTGYYINPASSSNIDEITVNGQAFFYNWVRTYGEEGLYSQSYGQHFYPDSGGYYWESDGPIRVRDGFDGSTKGVFGYHDSNGKGVLSANSSWWLNQSNVDDGSQLIIGGHYGANAHSTYTTRKLMFGGGNADAQGNYYIGTNLENVGGNYNKLDFRWHTGIRMGAQSSYGGIRLYDSEDLGTVQWQFNGGSGYTYKYNWMYVNTSGFYSDTNGAHLKPNDGSSYGSWHVQGSRNGWRGIHFYDGGNTPHLMFDGSSNGGIYYESTGRWAQYYSHSNNCWGIGSSTTSSSYGIYDSAGGIYSTGNITAYSDRRAKENIVPIENALETVEKIQGVKYNKIGQEKTEVGFIAQDINEHLPEVVTYAEDIDQYGVAYGNVTALLVEAVKELSAEVKRLKEKLGE